MSGPLLQVKSICARYEEHTVLNDLSFNINQGDIGCLLGPSGCGKTTALRAIAGFQPISKGEIIINGRIVSTALERTVPEKRHLGMVFQDYALFPHLTIGENIAFGCRKLDRHKKSKLIKHYLELVDLKNLEQRYPHELSGGQQQRVALARAMAHKPSMILLDEPFSNLDVDLRRRLGMQVRSILKEEGITGLLVTHDQEEAFAVSDKVGVISDGRLQQWDTPYSLYHEPVNRFVASFIGLGHFIRGKALSPEAIDTELGVITGNRAFPWVEGTPVEVLLRPDDIQPYDNSELKAQVVEKTFAGASMLYTLQLPTGSIIQALFPSHHNHAIDEFVGIRLEADHLVAFATPTD